MELNQRSIVPHIPPPPPLEENAYDLLSELAQQTDKRTTGLQILIERQGRAAEEKDKKRWAWFYAVVLSVFVAVCILGFETWERHYDRLSTVEKQLVRIEESLNNLKDSVVKKNELNDELNKENKERDEIINRAIDNLRREFKRK